MNTQSHCCRSRLGAALGGLLGKFPRFSCKGEKIPPPNRVWEGTAETAPSYPAGRRSLRKGSVTQNICLCWFTGRMAEIFQSGLRKGIFVLEHATPQNCANAQPTQHGACPGQQAGQAGSDTSFWKSSSRARFSPEERGCPNHKRPRQNVNLSSALLLRRSLRWEEGFCPSPKLGQMFRSQTSAALSISKAGAVYPSICPLFSRISKRRGVSFCQALQLPAMSQALAIWIQTRLQQLLLQPRQGTSSSQRPQDHEHPVQPEPFPAIPHSCLYSAYANILKAPRTQGRIMQGT